GASRITSRGVAYSRTKPTRKERMQQTVVMVNLIVQSLYFATVLLVTALINGGPRLARSVSVDKMGSGSYLQAITGSPSYVYILARRLYQGNLELPRSQEASDAALAAYYAFRLFQVEAGRVLTPWKSSHPVHIGTSALDLAVQHVFTDIRSHYENAKEKRYKDFPKAKFTLSSITLTEDGLCHLLYGNTASENILKVYVAFTLRNTGILVRTLFGTGEHQGVLLISDEHSKDSRVLRPAFHTDGLTVTLLAHNLAWPKKKKKPDDGDGGGDDTRSSDIKGKGVKRDVEGPRATQRHLRIRRAAALSSSAGSDDDEAHVQELQTATKASRTTFQQEQDVLMQEGPGGASSSSAGVVHSRGAPSGKVAQSVSYSGSSSDHGGEGSGSGDDESDGEDDGDDDGDDDDGDDDEDDGSEFEWGSLEPPVDFDEEEEDVNNLGRFILKDADVAFKNLSRSSTSYPNRNTTRPIGIDPGVNIAAAAVMIDPTNPGKMEARAVWVSRKVLNKPTKYFAQRLQRRRHDKDIAMIESKIPTFSRIVAAAVEMMLKRRPARGPEEQNKEVVSASEVEAQDEHQSSSSAAAVEAPVEAPDAQDADVLANNYTYQPPALQQQQHAFAAPPVEPASTDPASASSQPTMCNKASSNPNRVVLPTNVTPSHYTLSITPDFKEFTFGGQVEIE
ncbi:hypothetical protein KVV02_007163, partial [Mortierella alpina]